MVNLNINRFFQCMYFVCILFLFSDMALSGGDEIESSQFDKSINGVFNHNNIDAENKVKVVFTGAHASGYSDIYINMDRKNLETCFSYYDKDSQGVISEIIVKSPWEGISPKIIVSYFECYFHYKEFVRSKTTYLMKGYLKEISPVFDESVDSWARVAIAVMIIDEMIVGELEYKQEVIDDIISQLEDISVDVNDAEKLHKIITFIDDLPVSTSFQVFKDILRDKIEINLHKLMIKAKEAGGLINFKAEFAYLLEKYPRVLSGSAGATLVVNPSHCNDLGQPISDEIIKHLSYFKEMGVENLTVLTTNANRSLIHCARVLFLFCDKPLCDFMNNSIGVKTYDLGTEACNRAADNDINNYVGLIYTVGSDSWYKVILLNCIIKMMFPRTDMIENELRFEHQVKRILKYVEMISDD